MDPWFETQEAHPLRSPMSAPWTPELDRLRASTGATTRHALFPEASKTAPRRRRPCRSRSGRRSGRSSCSSRSSSRLVPVVVSFQFSSLAFAFPVAIGQLTTVMRRQELGVEWF